MIGLGTGQPIFLATGVTDLRRGVDSLDALILGQLAQEPLSGARLAFCNRRCDAVKIFCHDEGGVRSCAERLEEGTFRWPKAGERAVRLTAADLHLLLCGVDPAHTRLRRWWAPVAPSAPGAARGPAPESPRSPMR